MRCVMDRYDDATVFDYIICVNKVCTVNLLDSSSHRYLIYNVSFYSHYHTFVCVFLMFCL